ncbi:MAG: fatty acid desaturase, partial [Anaerolineae bacterium]
MTNAAAALNEAPPQSAPAERKQHQKPTWVKTVSQYQKPTLWVSQWQLATSVIPYLALWALMAWSLSVSYLLTIGLAIIAGGFLMRIFVLQHDCGHQSLFKNRRWNDLVGFVLGVMTMTPYEFWRSSHAKHHATSGDLDHRG